MSQTHKNRVGGPHFNPWIGCTKVGPGCDNCYAKATWEDRKHRVVWGAGQARSLTKTWGDPVKWDKQHAAFFAEHGRRQRVFCASLADVFDNAVDPQWLSDLFELIRRTPNLDWLLLTKRIGNWKTRMQAVHDHLSARRPPTPKPRSVSDEESDAMNWVDAWIRNDVDPIPANVWLGATIVNQEEADRDIPKLLAVPAAKRFLSMEPLLGPVDLTEHLWGRPKPCDDCPKDADCECGYARRGKIFNDPALHWVIVGGESGPNARPMHPDWARGLRDQCQAAGVPFMFKQWGEWISADQDECPHGPPRNRWMWEDGNTLDYFDGPRDMELFCRAGKKAAGRLLDGITHDGVPS